MLTLLSGTSCAAASFHDNTIVFLMGCRIAAGIEGDTSCKRFHPAGTACASPRSRPSASVTAGASTSPNTQGASAFPGMRDTRFTNHKLPGMPRRDFERLEVWNDLQRLPWMSERSPHVKIAFRGVLIKRTPEPVGVFGTLE